ncbi:MAG: hypothetical protein ACKVKO_11310 [Acidimicrobiales bacterium]
MRKAVMRWIKRAGSITPPVAINQWAGEEPTDAPDDVFAAAIAAARETNYDSYTFDELTWLDDVA